MTELGYRVGRKAESVSVLVIDEDEGRRASVRRALLELVELKVNVTEGASPRDQDGSADTDVVMVIVGRDEDAGLACLREQAGRFPRPTLFAVLAEQSSKALVRSVLGAGADEVLVLPLDHENLTCALLKISEAHRRKERKAGARVCALTSVVGGVGVTTLTANLGLALQRYKGLRVGLVDLDLQEGGLGVLLDSDCGRGIGSLARLEKPLDSMTLELALTRHASGIYVLAAPRRIEDSESISEVTIEAVIEQMSLLFDYVLIDCGHRVDGNAVAAWERSQDLIYVLDQSVSAARCAWRFMDLFERLKIDIYPKMILNRYNPAYSITEAQIVSALHRPIYARVPRDDALMEISLALARTPWQVASRSSLVRAYEDLACRLAGRDETNKAMEAAAVESSFGPGGLVRRLMGAFTPTA